MFPLKTILLNLLAIFPKLPSSHVCGEVVTVCVPLAGTHSLTPKWLRLRRRVASSFTGVVGVGFLDSMGYCAGRGGGESAPWTQQVSLLWGTAFCRGVCLRLSSPRERWAHPGRRLVACDPRVPRCRLLGYGPLLQEDNQTPLGLQSSGDPRQDRSGQTLVWTTGFLRNLKTPAWNFAAQVLSPYWEVPLLPNPSLLKDDWVNSLWATVREQFSKTVKVTPAPNSFVVFSYPGYYLPQSALKSL